MNLITLDVKTYAYFLVIGILIAMVIGRLGIYLVPKMIKIENKSNVGARLMVLFFTIGLVWDTLDKGLSFFVIGKSIGIFIPLVIGSYLIANMRPGTAKFDQAIKRKEFQCALYGNAVLVAVNILSRFYYL